jgi:hypothetical protein
MSKSGDKTKINIPNDPSFATTSNLQTVMGQASYLASARGQKGEKREGGDTSTDPKKRKR